MIVLVDGKEEPYAWGSIDIDDAIGQRSTASYGVIDKDRNKRFKRGQNVEIYDFNRSEELSKTANYAGKIAGSVTENPHFFKYLYSSALVNPLTGGAEAPQAHIDAVKTLNYSWSGLQTSTSTHMAQALFSFNLIEHIRRNYGFTPSVDWLKANIAKTTANWYGKGSGPSGNKATAKAWANTNTWNGNFTHSNASISELSVYWFNEYNYLYIQSDGFVHFLAYAEASNGTIASKIETDFVELVVELKPDYLIPEKLTFGGVIARPVAKFASLGGGGLIHGITCADWHYFADKRIIAKAYENTLAGEIVRDIITRYLAEEGITPGTIQDGPEIIEAVFNYIRITDAFESLCEKAGFEWHIDANKQLHFFARSVFNAPVNITETSDIKNVEVEPAAEDYRNKQYIRAGKDITDPQTVEFKGDGKNKSFIFPYELAKEPIVKVDGVTQTVGIRGLEEGQQWYWNKGDKVVTQDDNATPLTASQTLSITGQGYFDIVVLSYDPTAIETQKAIEGGTGVHEDVLDDPYLTSRAAAFESASAKLRRYARIGNRVTFDTKITGLRAGQLINIDLPSFDITTTDFLIESIKASELGTHDGRLIYQVSAVDGAASGGWANFFKKMATRGQAFVIRENIQENEVLITFSQFTKTWTQAENPNLLKPLYPSATLYPGATVYPYFTEGHKVKYVSFFNSSNVEIFRKTVAKVVEEPTLITTTALILPYEANGLDIAHIGFWGGSHANGNFGTGILLDKQTFAPNKTDMEMMQIEKKDMKGW